MLKYKGICENLSRKLGDFARFVQNDENIGVRGEDLPLAPKPSRSTNRPCKQDRFSPLCWLVRYPFCGLKRRPQRLPFFSVFILILKKYLPF